MPRDVSTASLCPSVCLVVTFGCSSQVLPQVELIIYCGKALRQLAKVSSQSTTQQRNELELIAASIVGIGGTDKAFQRPVNSLHRILLTLLFFDKFYSHQLSQHDGMLDRGRTVPKEIRPKNAASWATAEDNIWYQLLFLVTEAGPAYLEKYLTLFFVGHMSRIQKSPVATRDARKTTLPKPLIKELLRDLRMMKVLILRAMEWCYLSNRPYYLQSAGVDPTTHNATLASRLVVCGPQLFSGARHAFQQCAKFERLLRGTLDASVAGSTGNARQTAVTGQETRQPHKTSELERKRKRPLRYEDVPPVPDKSTSAFGSLRAAPPKRERIAPPRPPQSHLPAPAVRHAARIAAIAMAASKSADEGDDSDSSVDASNTIRSASQIAVSDRRSASSHGRTLCVLSVGVLQLCLAVILIV